MSTTYLSNKYLSFPAYNDTGWSTPLNATIINSDSAFGGTQYFNLASAPTTVAVSGTVYAGAYPGSTPSYVPLTWTLTGLLTNNVTLTLPSGVGGQWIVYNNTTGSYTVTVQSLTGGGGTTQIPQASIQHIYCDQTNVYGAAIPNSSNLTWNNSTLALNGNETVSGNVTMGGTAVMGSSFLRNRLINGNFIVDQRNNGATWTATNGAALNYQTDRWLVSCVGGNVTGASANIAFAGYPYLLINGAASVTQINLAQRIEGANCFDLAGGNAVFSVQMANTLLTSATWTVSYANNANQFGAGITTIATGTFTGITSTLATFNTGAIAMPASAVNGVQVTITVGSQTSGTWTITNAQFEPGSVATPFERKLYNQVLLECQRYFVAWRDLGSGNTPLPASGYTVANSSTFTLKLPTTMYLHLGSPSFNYFSTTQFTIINAGVSSSGAPTVNSYNNDNLLITIPATGAAAGLPVLLRFNTTSGLLSSSFEVL